MAGKRRQEAFVVTTLSRQDLESLGFNTKRVSDFKMERLASKLSDDYCEQLFWISLQSIAEYERIPKRRK